MPCATSLGSAHENNSGISESSRAWVGGPRTSIPRPLGFGLWRGLKGKPPSVCCECSGPIDSSFCHQRSPVFLLFLDCVWQLLQQFPSAFQFSEMYLTSLWDSFCFGLFDNFLFNCIRERELARNETRVAYGSPSTSKLMSVWDWSKQFSEEAISLFNNPLYRARSELDLNSNRTSNGPADKPPSYSMKLSGLSSYNAAIKPTVLRPVISHPLLKFWSHCYLRWLTPVQILSGGTPSEYLQQCVLVEEIICLRHKIKSLELSTPFTKAARPKSRLIFETADNPSNKLSWSGNVTSSFPYTPRRNPSQLSYFETPITVYLENSFIGDDISLASCDFETSQSDTDLWPWFIIFFCFPAYQILVLLFFFLSRKGNNVISKALFWYDLRENNSGYICWVEWL